MGLAKTLTRFGPKIPAVGPFGKGGSFEFGKISVSEKRQTSEINEASESSEK